MTGRITVVVADDHPLYRSGVTQTLNAEADIDVVAEAASADEAVAAVRAHAPRLALIDLSMPGGGLEAIRRIAGEAPEVRLVALTVSEADDDVIEALDGGATGYVLKGVGGDDLLAIVRDVADGGSYVSPALAARLLTKRHKAAAPSDAAQALNDLSLREAEILRLVARGLSNKEIGRALDLQEKTIKHYMTLILQKLNLRNRVEAAVVANSVWGAEK